MTPQPQFEVCNDDDRRLSAFEVPVCEWLVHSSSQRDIDSDQSLRASTTISVENEIKKRQAMRTGRMKKTKMTVSPKANQNAEISPTKPRPQVRGEAQALSQVNNRLIRLRTR